MSKVVIASPPIPHSGTLRDDVTGWRRSIVKFRVSASYLKLFEISFAALDNARPFDPDRVPSNLMPPADRVPEEVDVLVTRQEVLVAPVPVLEALPNMLRYVPRQLQHFFTDLRGGPEAAFRSMSSKTRSTVTRKVKQFEKFCGGAVTWRAYRSPDEMTAFHEAARRIAGKTYQERLFDAGLPDTEPFLANMRELADRDLVRGFILFHADTPVAYLYTPAPDGFLIYDYLGYDPAYASHSPGTVLQYLVLKGLYEEGRYPLYYWGYGYSQTKQIFSTGQVLAADVYYVKPTLRNQLAIRMHYGSDLAAAKVGELLARAGAKERIKRWMKRL